jgi:hypothetical protein
MTFHNSWRLEIMLRRLVLLLCALALATPPAWAADSCVRPNEPGASLLFPFFEVDLDFSGRTTLIAVAHSSENARLARVVLWTNWGLPTYSFDVYLHADGVQTINLRDLFLFGTLPVTGPGSGPISGSPSCTVPLSNPPLDAATLLDLRAKHGGAVAGDGFCHGSPVDDGLLTGFATVDVINDCSTTIRNPGQAGYFTSGGAGVASNQNHLWGDFFLVDPSQDLAQGFEAVTLRSNTDLTADQTFYRRLPNSSGSNREPLSSKFSTRYLNGGTFDGGTDLLVWREWGGAEPDACNENPVEFNLHRLNAKFFDEAGNELTIIDPEIGGRLLPILAERVTIKDGGDFEPTADFGKVELELTASENQGGAIGVPVPDVPLQSWIGAYMSAQNRFSVGIQAIRRNDLCSP